MAKLTKADAARQLRISRTTLYKLIEQGKVSPTPDGLIDTAELVRVMSTMNVHGERQFTPFKFERRGPNRTVGCLLPSTYL
jgi:DNA-binding XRE family transcriptional regulator